MRIARLDLLCDRVHVAKAPFEWIAANIAVAPDMRYAVSTTLADWWMVQVAASRTALRRAELAGRGQIAPHRIRCRIEIGARGAQVAFGADEDAALVA
ncbi:hypothetical protein ACVWXO_003095 [Bradyrhizobium sp. LM2.7]